MKLSPSLAAAALGLVAVTPALAQSESFVLNFEEFETGPSAFAFAGDAQELEIPGRVRVSGGVLLGFANSFPAIDFATSPNTFSTTNIPSPSFGQGLLPTLTLDIDETFEVFQLEGLLFNGVPLPRSFSATAFSGAEVIAELNFDNLPGNLSEGNAVFAFESDSPITRVEVSALDTTFNFVIDTIAFNQSISEAFEESVNPGAGGPAAVPSPAALPLGLLMLGGLMNRRRRC